MQHSNRFVFATLLPSALLLSTLLGAPWAGAAQHEVIYPSDERQQRQLSISASVEAEQHALLASQQAGLLAELYVEVGDQVKAGEPLLSLDSELAKLERNQARARVSATKAAADEAQRLHLELKALAAKKFVGASQISERQAQAAESKAELRQAQAALAIKQEQLRRHTLYAPFDGLIAQRLVNIGEWVTPQSPAFSLVEQDKLRLKLAIPQEYWQQTKLGAAVSIAADYDKQQQWTAKIDRLVSVSDRQSRAFTAYVSLPPAARLTVGMSATVSIQLSGADSQRLWLPDSAIKRHPDGGASVFALEAGKAKRYLVTIAEQRDGRSAVLGAPAGRAYVAKGVELLSDGDQLDIAKGQEPSQ
ncbi:MAG: efflux RND transporter periplasmic adaptor subunit [Cellvibrionaceae bacterium]|nr:efflux RND transporter periplasmic adaptor subunit [Cellvibrionaceae bacterium]